MPIEISTDQLRSPAIHRLTRAFYVKLGLVRAETSNVQHKSMPLARSVMRQPMGS